MKIPIENISNDMEEENGIHCHEVSNEIFELMSRLKTKSVVIIGYDGYAISRLELSDVDYFKSVGNKVLIYCRDKVYKSKKKLYELEQLYCGKKFFRASKFAIINIAKISNIKPSISGRFEVHMNNGEVVMVSRQYVPVLKSMLGLQRMLGQGALWGLLRQLIRDFFIILGILIISTLLLAPLTTISRDYILLALVFAAISDLTSILFWSRSELTENAMLLRIAIQFILFEAIILVFGGIVGFVSGFMEYGTFGVEVGVIYVLARFVLWRGDLNTVKLINEKLKDNE